MSLDQDFAFIVHGNKQNVNKTAGSSAFGLELRVKAPVPNFDIPTNNSDNRRLSKGRRSTLLSTSSFNIDDHGITSKDNKSFEKYKSIDNINVYNENITNNASPHQVSDDIIQNETLHEHLSIKSSIASKEINDKLPNNATPTYQKSLSLNRDSLKTQNTNQENQMHKYDSSNTVDHDHYVKNSSNHIIFKNLPIVVKKDQLPLNLNPEMENSKKDLNSANIKELPVSINPKSTNKAIISKETVKIKNNPLNDHPPINKFTKTNQIPSNLDKLSISKNPLDEEESDLNQFPNINPTKLSVNYDFFSQGENENSITAPENITIVPENTVKMNKALISKPMPILKPSNVNLYQENNSHIDPKTKFDIKKKPNLKSNATNDDDNNIIKTPNILNRTNTNIPTDEDMAIFSIKSRDTNKKDSEMDFATINGMNVLVPNDSNIYKQVKPKGGDDNTFATNQAKHEKKSNKNKVNSALVAGGVGATTGAVLGAGIAANVALEKAQMPNSKIPLNNNIGQSMLASSNYGGFQSKDVPNYSYMAMNPNNNVAPVSADPKSLALAASTGLEALKDTSSKANGLINKKISIRDAACETTDIFTNEDKSLTPANNTDKIKKVESTFEVAKQGLFGNLKWLYGENTQINLGKGPYAPKIEDNSIELTSNLQPNKFNPYLQMDIVKKFNHNVNPIHGRLFVVLATSFALTGAFFQSLIYNLLNKFGEPYNCGGVFVEPFSKNAMLGACVETLNVLGGLVVNKIRNGEIIRMFWANWMHAGFIHIGFNVLAQAQLGYLLEPDWGMLRFFLLFWVSCIGGNLLVAIVSPCSLTVGSSGGLFGITAGALVYTFEQWGNIPNPLFIFVIDIISMILGMVLSFTGVTNPWAHIGGFIVGLLFTFATLKKCSGCSAEDRLRRYNRIASLPLFRLCMKQDKEWIKQQLKERKIKKMLIHKAKMEAKWRKENLDIKKTKTHDNDDHISDQDNKDVDISPTNNDEYIDEFGIRRCTELIIIIDRVPIKNPNIFKKIKIWFIKLIRSLRSNKLLWVFRIFSGILLVFYFIIGFFGLFYPPLFWQSPIGTISFEKGIEQCGCCIVNSKYTCGSSSEFISYCNELGVNGQPIRNFFGTYLN